jgi:ADP-ribosylglycohydrolase
MGFARDSLAGLSVGDALGAHYFVPGNRAADLLAGSLPPPVWEWTDDTEMACSVVWMLSQEARIDPDRLASAFAERCEPYRGYGAGAFTILRRIRQGQPWSQAAGEAFDGEGSCGNGAAMRVPPLGAYFADSPSRAAQEAAIQARLTHAHPEGIAGAEAVAVAASLATAARFADERPRAGGFVDSVLSQLIAPTRVRAGVPHARKMVGAGVDEAAYELGNGAGVTAQDTVPFTIWIAARHLDDYAAAIQACISAGGDIDTTAAITGGIVAAYTGTAGIPDAWLASREPLPEWLSGRG